MSQNDHLVLICGKSATGKSASLMNLKNPEGVMYLNCESGKRLPFRSKFQEFTIVDPLQVKEAFAHAETKPDIHTIVIDSLTYLMDMFESNYVLTAANTMKGWSDYAQFGKTLLLGDVARSTKNVIFLAHTVDQMNENTAEIETYVPVKGSLKNNGIESYFGQIVSTKKVPIKKLEGYENELLTITPEEEALGYKHVFQTKITKDTTGERMRGPMGLFSSSETYVDNDCQKLMDRLHEYYD